MIKKSLVFVAVLLLAGALNAEAAWVTYNKKPVTAWQGFQNSANGFVNNVLPWNWFGKRDNA